MVKKKNQLRKQTNNKAAVTTAITTNESDIHATKPIFPNDFSLVVYQFLYQKSINPLLVNVPLT